MCLSHVHCAESLQMFRQGMSTLCNTTIADTLTTVKNCEAARYVKLLVYMYCMFQFELSIAYSSGLYSVFSCLATDMDS